MAKTRAALDALDPGTRVAMEGHRPGTYVRIVLPSVPCELVQVCLLACVFWVLDCRCMCLKPCTMAAHAPSARCLSPRAIIAL